MNKNNKTDKKKRDLEIQVKKQISKTEIEMFQLAARAHDGKGNLVWSK